MKRMYIYVDWWGVCGKKWVVVGFDGMGEGGDLELEREFWVW